VRRPWRLAVAARAAPASPCGVRGAWPWPPVRRPPARVTPDRPCGAGPAPAAPARPFGARPTLAAPDRRSVPAQLQRLPARGGPAAPAPRPRGRTTPRGSAAWSHRRLGFRLSQAAARVSGGEKVDAERGVGHSGAARCGSGTQDGWW
jgi:hypothetical protein